MTQADVCAPEAEPSSRVLLRWVAKGCPQETRKTTTACLSSSNRGRLPLYMEASFLTGTASKNIQMSLLGAKSVRCSLLVSNTGPQGIGRGSRVLPCSLFSRALEADVESPPAAASLLLIRKPGMWRGFQLSYVRVAVLNAPPWLPCARKDGLRTAKCPCGLEGPFSPHVHSRQDKTCPPGDFASEDQGEGRLKKAPASLEHRNSHQKTGVVRIGRSQLECTGLLTSKHASAWVTFLNLQCRGIIILASVTQH